MAANNDLGSLSYSLNIDISQLPNTIRDVEKQLSTVSAIADISTRVDSNHLITAIKQALVSEEFKLKVSLDDSFKSAMSDAATSLKQASLGGEQEKAQIGYIESLIQKLKELELQYKALPKGADTSAIIKDFASVQAELDKAGKNISAAFNKSFSEIDKMSESTIGELKNKIRSLEQYKLNIPLTDPSEITRVDALINKLKGDISALFQTQQVNPFELPETSIKEIETKIKAIREVRSFSPINSQEFIDADNAVVRLKDTLSSIGRLSLKEAIELPEKTIEDIKNKIKELEAIKIKSPINSQDLALASDEVERLKKSLADIKNPPKASRSFAEVIGMDTNSLNQISEKLNEIRRLRGEISISNPGGLSQINSLNKAESDLLKLQQQRLGTNKQINESYRSQGEIVNNLIGKAIAYFSVQKMEQFASKLIEIRGEFEKQQVALQVILQSKDQADKLFSQVVDLGLKSPFSIMQLNSYVKGLAAYRIETDQLFDTTKRLADISSGLGVDMSRLILAYGQVRAASVLRGQEVRQFTEAGIPLIEALADKFTKLEGRVVSTNEVFDKISNRLVPFEMVRDVLFEMTDAGGVFFNMQEKQAETLGSKWKNLQDAIDVMYNSIGQDNEGFLKDIAVGLTAMTENWRTILDYTESAVAALVTYKTLTLTTGASDILVKSLMATRNVTEDVAKRFINMQTGISGGFSKIGMNINRLTASVKSFLVTNGWLLLAAAIAAVGVKIYNAYQESKRFGEELDRIASSGKKEAEALEKAHSDLLEKIKSSTQGTIAYKEAMNDLSNQFGAYYNNINFETAAYSDLEKQIKQVNAAIQEKSRLTAIDKAFSRIEENFGDELADAEDRIRRHSRGANYGRLSDTEYTELLTRFNNAIKAGEVTESTVNSTINRLATEYGLSQQERTNMFSKGWTDYYKAISKIEGSRKDADNSISARYGSASGLTKQQTEAFKAAEKEITDSLKETEKQIKNTYTNENIANEKIANARANSIKQLQELSKNYSNYKLSEYDAELRRVEINSSKIRDAVKKTLGYDSKYFSPFSAMEDAKSIQDAYRSLKETLKDPTTDEALIKDAKDRAAALKKVADELGVDLDPKASTKGAKAAEDARLARYKAEISLVKEAYSSYKNYLEVLDEANAKSKVEENFASQFTGFGVDIKYASDELSYFQSISDELSKGGSKKDIALWNSVSREIGGKQSDSDLEALKKEWKDLNDLFDLKKEAYNLRDMYMLKGISKDVAESFVKQIYGDIPLEFESFQDDVSNKLSETGGNWGSESGKSFRKRFGQEAKNSFLDMLDKFQTTQQKIEGINYKYSQVFTELSRQRTAENAKENDEMVANAEAARAEELAAVTATAIQMTDAYQRMFGNISEMSEKELNYLIQKWKAALAEATRNSDGTFTINLDGVDFKTTEQQIASFTKKVLASETELRNKNPFKALTDSLSELRTNSQLIGKLNDELDLLKQERDSADSVEDIEYLNDKIKETEDSLQDLGAKNATVWSRMSKQIDTVTNKITELSGSFISLLDSLGASESTKDSLNDIVGLISGLGDTAAGIAKISSGEDIIGGLTQGIKGVAGIISSIDSLFGGNGLKEYEKAVAMYERMEDVLSKVIDRQKELIGISVGSQSSDYFKNSIDAIEKQLEYGKTVLDRFMDSGGGLFSHSKGYRENRYISGWQDQLRDNGFDIQSWEDLYNLTAEQIYDLQERLPEFYADLFDETKDYLQLVVDKEEELLELTELYKESLTGLGFDALLNSLDSLLQSSETTFSQIGDSFDDSMRNAVLNFVKNKYLRDALTNWYDQFANFYKDDELTSSEVDTLRRMYEEIYNKAQSMYDAALGVAGISKDDSNLSGLSKGIQGLTEDTAQILEAYLNTIRDVVISIMIVNENQLSVLQTSQLIQSQILTEVATMSSATVAMNNALHSVIAQSNGDNGAGIRVYIK